MLTLTNALTAIATVLYHHTSFARQQGDRMLNALWIVLSGMAIIFAVLGILFLVMVLLNKLVRPREKKDQKG
jgi:uncharacterized membrane protein